MSPVAARTAALRTAAVRSAARRQMSTEPKMHTAKDKWADFAGQRPPKDHLDEHLVFHPPYNVATAAIGLLAVFGLGYGSMGFGMVHQQYKQGYWK